MAGHLVPFIGVTGGIEAVDRLYATAEQVTPEDIQRAARSIPRPQATDRRRLERSPAVKYAISLCAERGEQVFGCHCWLVRSADVPPHRTAGQASSGTLPSATGCHFACLTFCSLCTTAAAAEPIPLSQCVLLPVADDPTISFRLCFTVGSQDDPPGKEGLAAFTARMIAEGSTKQHRYEAILDLLFPLAGGYEDSCSVEMTVISGRIHKDNVADYYPLLMQAIVSPGLPPGRPRAHQATGHRLPGKRAPLLQRRGVGQVRPV